MRKPGKVLVLGEILLDLFAEPKTIDYTKIKHFVPLLGGGSANVSVCLARRGIPACYAGAVGDDDIGEMLLELMEKEGVDVSRVVIIPDIKTGVIFITRDNRNERYFCAIPRIPACLAFTQKEINKKILNGVSIFHFGSSNFVDPEARRAAHKVLDEALKKKLLISFDLNLRPGNWKNYEVEKKVIWNVLKKAHIVKASEEEILYLTEAGSLKQGIKQIVGKVPILAISLAEKGAEVFYFGKKVLAVKAPKVKVVDTTGAGDAFCAGYLEVLYRRNVSVDDVLEKRVNTQTLYYAFSNAVKLGSAVCSKVGAVTACPKRRSKYQN